MIELAQHIETLLLNNDCVIIPDFGGFVAHYSSAKWIEEEGLFLPPTRIIGFNPHLKINDGLLVQSFMQAYDTDFSDATKKVKKNTDRLINTLHQDGSLELHGIGKLRLTINNTYEFQPNEDGVSTPELYGLSSFEIEELNLILLKGKEDKVLITNVHKSGNNVYEIKINRSLLRNVVAAAVAVVAFFFLSTPVENSYIEKENYAQLFSLNLLGNVQPQTQSHKTNLKPKVVRVEKVALSTATSSIKTKEQKGENGNEAITENQPINELSKIKYNIIIASVANQIDAQKVIDNFKKQGYTDVSIISGSGRTRISIMSFTNKDKAYKKLTELKQNQVFKDAWLLLSGK